MQVSCVIPTYNCAAFVPRAVASACGQAHIGEVIVVDDGSTDATEEALAALCADSAAVRNRLHYVRQANAGPSAARNHGVRLARSPWVAFLDADDYWYPRKLEKQIAFRQSCPGGVLYFSGVDIENNDGRRRRALPPRAGPIEWADLLLWNWVESPTPLLCIEVFHAAGGFDENRSLAEDWDLWLRIAERGSLVAQREALACYWDRSEGLHASPGMMEGAWEVLLQAIRRQRGGALRPGLADRAFASLFLGEAYDLALSGDRQAAIGRGLQALHHDWRKLPAVSRLALKSALTALQRP
jgi:glycosyltransferase involved in cell wall biosynthesis